MLPFAQKKMSQVKVSMFFFSFMNYRITTKKNPKHVVDLGNKNGPMKLTVWKTIPFVEDKCVSGTEAVRVLCGFR